MKKLLFSLLGITLIVTALTSGAFCYMTAQAVNIDNTITSGKMSIGTDPEPFMTINGIMPGDTHESTVTVFTRTATKFYYKIRMEKQAGDSRKLWNSLMVEARDCVTGEKWSGELVNLYTDWFAKTDGIDGGGPDNGHPISFKIWIPQGVDMDEETSVVVRFKFDAEQWRPIAS